MAIMGKVMECLDEMDSQIEKGFAEVNERLGAIDERLNSMEQR